MKFIYTTTAIAAIAIAGAIQVQRDHPQPFGPKFPALDGAATGEWWKVGETAKGKNAKKKGNPKQIIEMDVPRKDVVAFALYTHDHGTLKMSAQLYPLKPGEAREVSLELKQNGKWTEVRRADVIYPGWSAHFRLRDWDNTKDVEYRVRHGKEASFAGLIRKDPVAKDVIVVGNLSCNFLGHSINDCINSFFFLPSISTKLVSTLDLISINSSGLHFNKFLHSESR